jgi:tetratricopeptide (TPR) repeat protein
LFRATLVSAFGLAFFWSSLAFAQAVSVEISRIGDASHFEFNGARDWNYELKRQTQQGQVVLRMPGLKAESVTRLRGYADGLIKGISIQEEAVDGATVLTFQLVEQADFFDYLTEQPSRLIVDFFPKNAPSEQSPSGTDQSKKQGAAQEHRASQSGAGETSKQIGMDERKPAGSDFIIVKKTPSKLPAKSNLKNESNVVEADSANDQERHGIFDGGDPEYRRFTMKDYELRDDAIIASRANFYLPFPMLKIDFPQLRTLVASPPSYEIIPNDTRENKEARVLATLFSTGRKALLFKTADEFLKKHPNSDYEEIIRYMIADSLFSFWLKEGQKAETDFEKAMNEYHLLIEKYPKSPATPRTLLLMGYSYMARGDAFAAVKIFQKFMRMYPESKHTHAVKIAIAESYLRINRFVEAAALLDEVERTPSAGKYRFEAAFRKGDALFTRGDWPGAISAYQEVLKKYPKVVSEYPNALYNIAEAEFTQGKYREALNAYRQFLEKFPDHRHGGYAMTRIGEIMGILGAGEKRAQGAFIESAYRYRGTPGAGIARIRALTGRMPDMKDKELASALREVETITLRYANRPDVTKACLLADAKLAKENAGHSGGASGAKDDQKTENSDAKEGQEGAAIVAKGPEALDGKYGKIALDDICQRPEDKTERNLELPGIEEFSTLLIADGRKARGEHAKATEELIEYYQKYPQAPNKDKIKARIALNMTESIRNEVEQNDFLEALRMWSKNSSGWLKNTDRIDVRSYVGKAFEQAGVYKEAETYYRDVLKKLAGLSPEQVRSKKIFERLPSPEQIHLRLAAVAAKGSQFSESEAHLKNITSANNLNPNEQIEFAEISAEVAEARGQSEKARRFLTNLLATWKGEPKLTAPLHLRIAKLHLKTRNFKACDENISEVLKLKAAGLGVSDELHASALELRGDAYLAAGKTQAAVQAYEELLATYESRRPLGSIRYRVGQVLYDGGDMLGAQKTWSDLKPDRDGMWAKMAEEKMQDAKWQSDYKKYLNRIPAASNIRENQ